MSRDGRGATRPPLTEAQRSLVEATLGLAGRVARGLRRRYPDADEEELRSAGLEALSEAARTYDPSKNDSFACYAWAHVYGAMADELRAAASWRNGAAAAARQLGIDLAQRLRDESDPFAEASGDLERRVGEAGDEVAAAVVLGLYGGALGRLGEEGLVQREDYRRASAALRRELALLPEGERRLVELRYEQCLGLQEIADAVGVAKSTAGRRCAAVIERLRAGLARRGITSAPGFEAVAAMTEELHPPA
ncbi:sigma-70 family RNA polymerase sigma factor [Sorangium sp. So ce1024]|uniref:sigma-70 family RNA polymerase sigma factor n=1 Tax=unclassified Sorangium TaxID=2621164 RepID=UPI003F064266